MSLAGGAGPSRRGPVVGVQAGQHDRERACCRSPLRRRCSLDLPAPAADHDPASRALHPHRSAALDSAGARAAREPRDSSTASQVPHRLSLWFLTEYGAETVEAAGRALSPPTAVRTARRPKARCASTRSRVNDVGIAFVQAARQRGDECGPDSWRHEVAHPITPARGRTPAELVVADALLTYLQAGEDGALALHQRFIELDRGTARPAEQLAGKITRLRAAAPLRRRRLGRAAREPLWRSHYRAWPHLLIVLADQSRERMRQRIAAHARAARIRPGRPGASSIPVVLRRTRRPGRARAVRADLQPAEHPSQPVDWLGNHDHRAR